MVVDIQNFGITWIMDMPLILMPIIILIKKEINFSIKLLIKQLAIQK